MFQLRSKASITFESTYSLIQKTDNMIKKIYTTFQTNGTSSELLELKVTGRERL